MSVALNLVLILTLTLVLALVLRSSRPVVFVYVCVDNWLSRGDKRPTKQRSKSNKQNKSIKQINQ